MATLTSTKAPLAKSAAAMALPLSPRYTTSGVPIRDSLYAALKRKQKKRVVAASLPLQECLEAASAGGVYAGGVYGGGVSGGGVYGGSLCREGALSQLQLQACEASLRRLRH